MTSKELIKNWLFKGIQDHKKYMIVVCDTFDYEDYPVYADSDVSCIQQYNHYNGYNMQRVMEVYDLSKNIDKQLCEYKCMNLPK